MLKAIKNLVLVLLVAVIFLAVSAIADNVEANRQFQAGLKKMKAENYGGAVSRFEAAKLYADDPVLKANALKQIANCYGKQGLKYKEFNAVESLLDSYPTQIKYGDMVRRQFRLADDFFAGHRDPAFPVLAWIPWLKDKNRTIEMYEKSLANGPYAKAAPEARLRLGRLYINADLPDDAMKTLRQVVKMYPKTEASKYASLELANVLVQLSRKGDGDGAHAKEASLVLREFIKKHPKDPEIGWVKKSQVEVDNAIAQRWYDWARFYHRQIGRAHV